MQWISSIFGKCYKLINSSISPQAFLSSYPSDWEMCLCGTAGKKAENNKANARCGDSTRSRRLINFTEKQPSQLWNRARRESRFSQISEKKSNTVNVESGVIDQTEVMKNMTPGVCGSSPAKSSYYVATPSLSVQLTATCSSESSATKLFLCALGSYEE